MPASDKAEKEKAKRREKKERKDKERAERDAKDKESPGADEHKDGAVEPQQLPLPKSGKATPVSNASAPEASTSDAAKGAGDAEAELKSPVTESTGVRTPTSRRPPRNPWTLFIRMQVAASESELREFFGEAKTGVRDSFFVAVVSGWTRDLTPSIVTNRLRV